MVNKLKRQNCEKTDINDQFINYLTYRKKLIDLIDNVWKNRVFLLFDLHE